MIYNKKEGEKMFTRIKHLPDSEVREFPINEEARVKKAKELYAQESYILVADICVGGSLSKILNKAYELTNSIDTSWFKNLDIWVAEKAQNGCRSTSVGDVIEINDAPYMVASCGFTYIGEE